MRYDNSGRAGEDPGPPRWPNTEPPKKTTVPVKVRREPLPASREPEPSSEQGSRTAELPELHADSTEQVIQEGAASQGAPMPPMPPDERREWRRGTDSSRDSAVGQEATGGAAAGPATAAVVGELEEWRDRAVRLQAEMDNFRRRQQRLAQDQTQAERDRLLQGFLVVIDNLERALAAPAGDDDRLRQGIRLTHRAAMQFLQQEGVAQIQAESRPFDPAWHEAVATLPGRALSVKPNTVVQVVLPGYQVGDRLLRPAKVMVAV